MKYVLAAGLSALIYAALTFDAEGGESTHPAVVFYGCASPEEARSFDLAPTGSDTSALSCFVFPEPWPAAPVAPAMGYVDSEGNTKHIWEMQLRDGPIIFTSTTPDISALAHEWLRTVTGAPI